jgi:putative mRNA 3-end processing factor
VGLITFTDKGLYCKQGDFYIDPWQPVRRAVITHAHSDHARYGSNFYFAHKDSYHFLKARLGYDISVQTVDYNQSLNINGVTITLYPAGHIIGSAQVKVSYKGEDWVVSGDYKLEDDGVSTPFEPVKCHTFITESTFGLPIYQWKPQSEIINDIHNWVQRNQSLGRYSILSAYSLGKSQRLIHSLSKFGYKFFVHGAVYNMQQAVQQVMPFPDVTYLNTDTPKDEVKDGIIIVPSADTGNPWLRRWQPHAFGACSGWMQVRGSQRRRNADAGFPLSDHADWQGLLQAIKATGADCVYVTHGSSATLARYLHEEMGLKSGVVKTRFGEDEE